MFRWIGNFFGHFIKLDIMTSSKTKLGFSRFCVNVGMDKPLLTIVDLKSKWGTWSQPLVYENATSFYQ